MKVRNIFFVVIFCMMMALVMWLRNPDADWRYTAVIVGGAGILQLGFFKLKAWAGSLFTRKKDKK